MIALDPRLHAYRTDLADAALDGRVEAGRFVAPEPAAVRVGVADLRKAPRAEAPLDSQLLFGEPVACFERADGWAWVQSGTDGYVGYIRAEDLGPPPAAGGEPDHCVAELGSFLYPEPSLKAPRLDRLSFGSPVRAGAAKGAFVEVPGAGWIVARHLVPSDHREPDHVATALRFLGAPYLWGGRSSLGLDCSALVQLALAHAGIPCPRDSDHQVTDLGSVVERGVGRAGRLPALRRGDLVYMPGHVVIALDAGTILNANAYHMLVSIEPLADVCGRVAKESGRPLEATIDAVRRP